MVMDRQRKSTYQLPYPLGRAGAQPVVVVGVRARVAPIVHERHRRLQFKFKFPAHSS